MKVSNQLKQTIQLVIEEKNRSIRQTYDAAKKALADRVVNRSAPQLKKLASLKAQREKIDTAISDIEKQLEKSGLTESYHSTLAAGKSWGMRDSAAEELGLKAEYISERAILARLATATEKEGADVLAQLGIKQ